MAVWRRGKAPERVRRQRQVVPMFKGFGSRREPEYLQRPMDPDEMRIVMYSHTPVAGVPIVLRDLINKYTSHHCKAVTGSPGYRDGRRWGPPDALLRDTRAASALITEADVIMVHNGRLDRGLSRLMKGKRLLCYYHSEPHRVHRELERQGIPCYVIAQGHALLYKMMPVLPNLVDIEQAELKPLPDRGTSPFRLGFAPSNRNRLDLEKKRKNIYSAKGYPECQRALDEIRRMGIKVEMFEGIPYMECLKRRQPLHLMLDEVVTGSYHRCTLEAAAQGQVPINAVSKEVMELITEISEGEPPPWAHASPGSLVGEVAQLISNPGYLEELMQANRRWMEEHWHPKALLERYYIPAFRSARMV